MLVLNRLMFDLGVRANLTPALRTAIVVPLADNGNLIAVLALYSKDLPFTAEQVTLLEVLGPRIVSLAAPRCRSRWKRAAAATSPARAGDARRGFCRLATSGQTTDRAENRSV
jgi:hypothetical protein